MANKTEELAELFNMRSNLMRSIEIWGDNKRSAEHSLRMAIGSLETMTKSLKEVERQIESLLQ